MGVKNVTDGPTNQPTNGPTNKAILGVGCDKQQYVIVICDKMPGSKDNVMEARLDSMSQLIPVLVLFFFDCSCENSIAL